jgi:hypothetical protein
MTNSNSPAWQNVRSIEDLIAIVDRIDDRRKVIRVQAWNEGSWRSVYLEATAMKDDVAILRDLLQHAWPVLHTIAQAESGRGEPPCSPSQE